VLASSGRDQPTVSSADVKKKKLEIDSTSGEELESLAKEVITSDRELIQRMKNLLGQ